MCTFIVYDVAICTSSSYQELDLQQYIETSSPVGSTWMKQCVNFIENTVFTHSKFNPYSNRRS